MAKPASPLNNQSFQKLALDKKRAALRRPKSREETPKEGMCGDASRHRTCTILHRTAQKASVADVFFLAELHRGHAQIATPIAKVPADG
jgi:hypothetical protein